MYGELRRNFVPFQSVKDMFHLGFKVEVFPPIWEYVQIPMFKQLMDAFNTITEYDKST